MNSYYYSKLKELNPVLITPPRFIYHTELSDVREVFSNQPTWLEKLFTKFANWLRVKFGKKPIKVEMPEDIAKELENDNPAFKSVMSSFSGADIIVYKNDKVVGEVQSIAWYSPSRLELDQLQFSDYYDKDLAQKKPVIVKVTLCLFGGCEDVDFDDCNIKIVMANEYGAAMSRAITNVSELSEFSGANIDSVVTEKTLYLAAESMTKWKPGKE